MSRNSLGGIVTTKDLVGLGLDRRCHWPRSTQDFSQQQCLIILIDSRCGIISVSAAAVLQQLFLFLRQVEEKKDPTNRKKFCRRQSNGWADGHRSINDVMFVTQDAMMSTERTSIASSFYDVVLAVRWQAKE